jgi:RimJ/RimL family protein N-acetyltransferase
MRFPDDVPTLTLGDVTLRAHRLDDVDGIVAQCTDPVSVEHTTVPLGYDREMGTAWVAETIPQAWADDGEWVFAIESTHPDGVRRFSGSVSLRDDGERRAEIAFGAHPAVRGRGVMTTAIGLLLDWGFDDRDIETVVWYAHVGNVASRRVAWKVGFTFGGTLRRWLVQRGVYRDGWTATLHRDDARMPVRPWSDAPVVDGVRVRLRPLRESDAERVAESCSDPRTRQWIPGLPEPYTADEGLRFIRHSWDMSMAGTPLWAVTDGETDTLLGAVGVPRSGPAGLEIGYWAHPDARGRGVMTEAVGLLTRHAFLRRDEGGMGTHRLHISTAAGNAASRHVAETNGFVEFGLAREADQLLDGSLVDLVELELVRSRWAALPGHQDPTSGTS